MREKYVVPSELGRSNQELLRRYDEQDISARQLVNALQAVIARQFESFNAWRCTLPEIVRLSDGDFSTVKGGFIGKILGLKVVHNVRLVYSDIHAESYITEYYGPAIVMPFEVTAENRQVNPANLYTGPSFIAVGLPRKPFDSVNGRVRSAYAEFEAVA